jgi:hypothetical protein
MKYLSFSLWGDKPIYNVGTIKNAELWPKIYPEWKMIVYYNNTVPNKTIEILKKLNCELVDMSESKIYPCFWRFLASDLDDCEHSIIRDSDSRISEREKLAVYEWISSDKTLHVMRDHPAHRIPYGSKRLGILAGMWGIKGNKFKFEKSILEFQNSNMNLYGVDQTFLMKIYDLFSNDKITHDEFFENKPFPKKRDGLFFIGGRIDENDKPVGNDHLILKTL